MIFYGYDNCSTCKKAEKFLKDSGIIFEKNDIVTTPLIQQL
jgi:arsenate reductase-like glutaredoxin family protein